MMAILGLLDFRQAGFVEMQLVFFPASRILFLSCAMGFTPS
ncbi:hypothetical protein [Noviherbaspirillum sp.]|nr:hypothetical protein [Noviherbaspirillum sp.]HJV80794.1 hypothetical protein [Noviherbaspirillum sp.]